MGKTRRGIVLAVGTTCILIALALSQVGCATDVGNLAGDIGDQSAESTATDVGNLAGDIGDQSAESTAVGSLTDIPDETVEAVKKGPAILLSGKETYWPCSVDWYLERCSLLVDGKVVKGPGITRADLVEQVNAGKSWTLVVDDSNWKESGTVKTGQWGGQPWPAYISIAKVKITEPGKAREYLVARYNTFYAYNTLSGKDPDGTYHNQHWGDWEGVIQVWSRGIGDTEWGDPKELWTKSHESSFAKAGKVEKFPESEGGRMKAYSALFAHGTYPSAGAENVGAGDQHWGTGPAWDTGIGQSEIVEYVELEFAHEQNLGGDHGWLWEKAGEYGSRELVYGAKWFRQGGYWGQSRNSKAGIWPKVGNSPGSYLGFVK